MHLQTVVRDTTLRVIHCHLQGGCLGELPHAGQSRVELPELKGTLMMISDIASSRRCASYTSTFCLQAARVLSPAKAQVAHT